MKDLHPNKRLRNFSISSADGRSKLTAFHVRQMSDEEYLMLRENVRKRSLARGHTQAAQKQADQLLRKLSIARKGRKKPEWKLQYYYNKKDSVLLDAFYSGRTDKKLWRPYKKRKIEAAQINLDVFSLIDEPEATFNKFSEIAKAEANARSMRLNFTDSMCYDMSPYLLLALMQKDFPDRFVLNGLITEEVKQVLESVGLSDYMQIQTQGRPKEIAMNNEGQLEWREVTSPKNCLDDVMPFNLRSGGGIEARNLAKSEQRDEKEAENFLNTLKDWIKRHNPNQTISEEIEGKIKDVMTELFDNALRHGEPVNETGVWHTVGVLQKRKDRMGRNIVVCNIAILNTGKTISETLDMAPQEVLDDINVYVELHKDAYERETLKTVCAIQDRVSRIHYNDEENAALNGIGLMTSIMTVFNPLFVSNLPQYEPSFTLISGRSWVSATLPYIKSSGEHGKRQLAFNDQNDMTKPPSSECVKTLSQAFPGTIISLRFVIGADKLEQDAKDD